MTDPSEQERSARIRALNDELRKTFVGGAILLTATVARGHTKHGRHYFERFHFWALPSRLPGDLVGQHPFINCMQKRVGHNNGGHHQSRYKVSLKNDWTAYVGLGNRCQIL
jgi:hypothetical protein